jgi:excisionase family DNA binding protein
MLAACIGRGETAQIRVINGKEDITVPARALRLLVDILDQMARGNAVTIVPIHKELTTQEAADLLNVSRPHLVSLLEGGEIPFQKSGSHRRVRFSDLQKYRELRDQKRRAVLSDMTREAHEQGLNWD